MTIAAPTAPTLTVRKSVNSEVVPPEIAELPYRDSPSAARRAGRIAAAADRLTRRRRAMYLRDWFPEISLAERRIVSS